MMRYALCYATCLLLIACTDGTMLHTYKPLPQEGWDRSDTLVFDIPQAETDIDGTLTVGLRTAAHVGMQSIALAVELCDAKGNCHRNTLHYPLTDSDGNALAKGVNHHQYETQHLPLHLKKGQQTTVRIHHLMTHDTMVGITEVGIKIDRR